ncbi:MAG: heme lyase CcmF/NrfE family subunit [Actinobacteria bacterium]|nr:heme lyase CcmF/NrfE family subunit [Actinomycetota bacterium]
MALLGRAALFLAFGLVVYAALVGGYAAWRGRRRLLESARNALVAALVATVVASAVLLGALAAKDFTFAYVADHVSRELPTGYTLAAFWSGQEGSLLLWLLVLLAMGVAAVAFNPRLTRQVLPWTVPVLAAVASFFALLLVFVASPFVTQAAPADGLGLNPSLQNPYMLVHPPLLYLGYVGLTVPFAFAMAALASRRTDERWIVVTRRWTLAAWTFLGISILLGAKWAYEEVGWGGWYAWDPVENAALMPWLVATAYLHSVMVQEKKDMLRVWNVILVALAFALSLFGTFLTRSGILNSIHSFTQSSIGPWFLGFITVVVTASIVLILVRLPLLRSRTRLESLVSREAAFLYNNLFLVAFALTVLWGVLYPILSEAVRGVAVTVGAPYYDFFATVFGLPIVLLMGLGPLVAWRRASLRALGTSVLWPAGVALCVGVILLALGAGSSPAGLVGYSFAAFVLAAIALEFTRGTRARKALGSESWMGAFSSLVGRNRRRYGGYVVHAAIVLLLVGAVGIGAYGTTREAKLAPGDSLAVGGYSLTYAGSGQRRGPNAQELRARVLVSRDGEALGMLRPGKNRYFAEDQVSNEVAIRSDLLRGEDLFVIADQFNGDGSVFLKVFVNPLVNLIWLAGFVFLVGAAVAMWPDAREQRRLARRFAEGHAYVPGYTRA